LKTLRDDSIIGKAQDCFHWWLQGANLPLLPYWRRCNEIVLSWLLNSMDKTIRDSVLFYEIASDM